MAGPTLDGPLGLQHGPLVLKHWILRVTGLQGALLLLLVRCGETESGWREGRQIKARVWGPGCAFTGQEFPLRRFPGAEVGKRN